jgi:hypothetical protein
MKNPPGKLVENGLGKEKGCAPSSQILPHINGFAGEYGTSKDISKRRGDLAHPLGEKALKPFLFVNPPKSLPFYFMDYCEIQLIIGA